MLRRLFAAVIPCCSFLLASCGGNVATTPLPPSAIQSSTGATTFTLSAALTTTQLTVNEAGYNGAYTASSSNTAVATVAPSAQQSAANARSAQATIESSGNGETFTVTAVGNGNATIVVSDDHQHSSSFTIVVTGFAPSGPLAVSPLTLTFNGIAQTQTVTVTDPGTTVIASGCAGIATIGAVANGAFTVTSVAAGSCSITVSDAFTHQATIAVGVTTLGVPIQ